MNRIKCNGDKLSCPRKKSCSTCGKGYPWFAKKYRFEKFLKKGSVVHIKGIPHEILKSTFVGTNTPTDV